MDEWILDVNMELQRPQNPPAHEPCSKSIYRVPNILTEVNRKAYEPKLASFGPYHHNRRYLRPMEQHKHRALMQFLRRIAIASKTLDDVVIAMRRVEPSLIASYDALQVEKEDEDCLERGSFRSFDWVRETDEFLKLMIVDSCFALEIMLFNKRFTYMEQNEYYTHDPIFGAEGKIHVVLDLKRDMLLLENQLPILALTTLATIDGSRIEDVYNLIKDFYELDEGCIKNEFFHILHLYRNILTSKGDYTWSFEDNEHSATELRNAGVSFHTSDSKSFRDISFRVQEGILSLPPLEFDDKTESWLLNLMAFERLHANVGNEVTAYVFFMNGLINTADDVALLRTEKIIIGTMGSNQNIVDIFKKITKEAILLVFEDGKSIDVNKDLNNYCLKRRNQLRASFFETYPIFHNFKFLKNPWVVTPLLGGLFFSAPTIIQTVYTILEYYKS